MLNTPQFVFNLAHFTFVFRFILFTAGIEPALMFYDALNYKGVHPRPHSIPHSRFNC